MSKFRSKYTSHSRDAKSPSGLGKGLDGILHNVDTADTDSSSGSGLHQLLGFEPMPQSSPQIRQCIADAALEAIASCFSADAVVLVNRSVSSMNTTVSTKLPVSWNVNSALGFELFGRLWRIMNDAVSSENSNTCSLTDLEPVSEQVRREDQHLWFASLSLTTSVVSIAVVRPNIFSTRERARLLSLVRSVGVAFDGKYKQVLPEHISLGVTLRPTAKGKTAEVRIESRGETRQMGFEAAKSEMAVAKAAALLCGDTFQVTYTGSTRVDNNDITIVVLLDNSLGPLLGIAVRKNEGKPCISGPAEAVFSAAASVGLINF